jgi:hypothetical protein
MILIDGKNYKVVTDAWAMDGSDNYCLMVMQAIKQNDGMQDYTDWQCVDYVTDLPKTDIDTPEKINAIVEAEWSRKYIFASDAGVYRI